MWENQKESNFSCPLKSPGSSLLLFPSEGAAFCEPGPPTSGLAEDGGAARADDDCLRVREDCRDPVAPRALDVHEVRIWVLDEPLQFVPPLLILGQGEQQLFGKRHIDLVSFNSLLFVLATNSDL